MDSFRSFSCDRCRTLVVICSRCDRGNRFCGVKCRDDARAESVRGAAKKYQESEVGRRNHQRRQGRYRRKLADSADQVTHQGSAPEATPVALPSDPPDVAVDESWGLPAAFQDPDPPGIECCMCGRRVSDRVRFAFATGVDPG